MYIGESKLGRLVDLMYIGESKLGRLVDALALGGDEGRDKLR